MKRSIVFVLILVFALSMGACAGLKKQVQDAVRSSLIGERAAQGNSDDPSGDRVTPGKVIGPSDSDDAPEGAGEPAGKEEDAIDLSNAANKLIAEAEARGAFSEAAAEAFWLVVAGVEKSDAAPDWDWIVDEERKATYGDTPDPNGYGHGSILFEKAGGGEISLEEYRAWARKVFDATAKASDGGHNIVGWEFAGEDEDALGEVSFDDAMGAGADGLVFMQGWGFQRNGRNMVVYLSEEYDRDKDSAIGRDMYYYGVSADIAVGLQKSMDDTWADMEQAFEENEDAIRDALKDYAN